VVPKNEVLKFYDLTHRKKLLWNFLSVFTPCSEVRVTTILEVCN